MPLAGPHGREAEIQSGGRSGIVRGREVGMRSRKNGAEQCRRQGTGTPSCAQGAGRAATFTAVTAAPGYGMQCACKAGVGYPQGLKGSGMGHVALRDRLGWECFLPVARVAVLQVKREVRDSGARGGKRGKVSRERG